MTITLQITNSKPADKLFYGDVSEYNSQLIKSVNETIRNLPGCIGNSMESPDENTRIFTIVFDTVDSYEHYTEIRKTLPGWAERLEYNATHSIVSKVNETIA